MAMTEMFTSLGSALAGLMFVWAMFQQYFPYQLRGQIERYIHKFVNYLHPYMQITFDELMDERFTENRSEAYIAIQNYLIANSTEKAKRLKANMVKNRQKPIFSMADHEEVSDSFKGVKVWWASNTNVPRGQTISFYPGEEERRFYILTFNKRHRAIITGSYIDHVLEEGKAIKLRTRQRKLYTNNPSHDWHGWRGTKWSHIVFKHPASFDTLAMATKKKEEIKKDLIKFSKGKEYYAKIGRAWKRGYLLYGPPGTGKSTMIGAMANLLDYDVYDLELTTVKDNSELRKLLIETSAKSVIVIEDIDCSLDLTGQRKKEEKDDKGEEEKEKDAVSKKKREIEEESKNRSKVTLSGLLNFIDGLWSACGEERIIVFTTNFVDKLDPALIRRGRMDKHIEMGYCCFEAFKELANNYLGVEWHESFVKIEKLLGETNMTPADVAENLMLKSEEEDEESCLKCLIDALEASKEEDARKKAEEEDKKKAEEEARRKAEEEKLKASKEEKEAEKGVAVDKEAEDNRGVVTSGKEEKDVASGKKVKENGSAVNSDKEVKENGGVSQS